MQESVELWKTIKEKKYATQHNTKEINSITLTTLGQETRWALLQLRSPHGTFYRKVWQKSIEQ